MFIEQDDLIPIKIYYRKSGRHYDVYGESQFLEDKELTEEQKSQFKILNIKARPLTFGLYNEINEYAASEENRSWSIKRYKEYKLRRIIAEWDAKKEDKPVPVNEQTIMSLSHEIAEMIAQEYDKKMLIDGEEEKKS